MITNIDIALRLSVAAILGSAIGFERERLLWAAGIRTHMLVAVGSCLLMIVSGYGFQQALLASHVVLDPSRVAAQVVSGIGFLGAGSILLRGQMVRGLTTAASIWAVAAIGLASGGGMFFASIASTVIIIVILAGLKPLEEAYRSRLQGALFEIEAEGAAIDPDKLHKLLNVRAGQLKRVVLKDVDGGRQSWVRLTLSRISVTQMDRIAERLRKEAGVLSVTVKRQGSKMANADLDRPVR